MTIRSLLFVPGDSDKKLSKALDLGADILVLDLEDAVAPSEKPSARIRVREFLAAHQNHTSALWIRINPIQTVDALADLTGIISGRPAGIIQPKTRSASDLVQLGHYLDALEYENGVPAGHTRIIPVATETPAALFAIGNLSSSGPRLRALTWGAEDLSAAVCATDNKDENGAWTPPYQIARSLCLFAARAAAVEPIDTLFADFRNPNGLKRVCAEARRDGFVGKIAIHPDQVDIINQSFSPSPQEIDHALRIVELFKANPGVAALSMDGRMVDIPHLQRAESILARARRLQREHLSSCDLSSG